MSERDPRSLTSLVRAKADSLGFDAVAIARADVPLEAEFRRYKEFINAGMHGEMSWLAENSEVRRRLDTAGILEGAKSVICLARRYQRTEEDESRDPKLAQSIARYARGRDYHSVVRRKLRKLAAYVRTLGTEDAPVKARPLCDDAPVLERVWAARSGLGFIGKNGLLIVPGQGSFVLLGEVVTTLELIPDEPIRERCGSCTLCLEACPTRAFARPFVLDARRCIAYLTIELRGAIPHEFRDAVGGNLFGCDECQTVCPFNASGKKTAKTRSEPSSSNSTIGVNPFEPHERWASMEMKDLLSMDPQAWSEVGGASPVRRATADGLARNAALVLGNQGDSQSLDPLEEAGANHPSEVVREAAEWAVAKLKSAC